MLPLTSCIVCFCFCMLHVRSFFPRFVLSSSPPPPLFSPQVACWSPRSSPSPSPPSPQLPPGPPRIVLSSDLVRFLAAALTLVISDSVPSLNKKGTSMHGLPKAIWSFRATQSRGSPFILLQSRL